MLRFECEQIRSDFGGGSAGLSREETGLLLDGAHALFGYGSIEAALEIGTPGKLV